MNEQKERIQTDLLAIIKEGQNFSGAKEIAPGIRINPSREREFKRLCDNYYELEFNQIIENDTDTITPVYNALINLVNTENEEYFISKASSFVLETKDEIEKFKVSSRSINTINNAYKLTVRNLNDLYLKRENTPEWQQKVNELNDEVKHLSENTNIFTAQMLEARTKVNESLIKYAEEELQRIRNNFTNTTKEADRAVAMDNTVVLASDKVEYDNLYRLVLILKHSLEIKDIKDLVVLDNAMIVTNDQKDVLNATILPNIKLYNYIKAPEKTMENKEVTPMDVNNKFIENIKEALTKLKNKDLNDEYMIPDNEIERNLYMEILKIVNRANNSNFALTPVWDQVYVLGEDREKMIELMNKSKTLYKLNPDYKRKIENQELITKLYDYLDEIANNVNKQVGVTNLPIKSTKTINDRAWVVLDSDYEEASRIIDIIELLQNQTNNLYPVWGIANISTSDMPKFKRLANATKYFMDRIPNIVENEIEIEKVKKALRVLVRHAKNNPNEKLASNGLVLESDLPLYKLLEEKYSYLDAAKASDDLIEVNGVLIDSSYVSKYLENNEKINALLEKEMENKKNNTVAPEVVDTNKQVENNNHVDGEPIEINIPIKEEPTHVETSNNNNIIEVEPVKVEDVTPQNNPIEPEVKPTIDFTNNDKEIARLTTRLEKLKKKSSQNEQERKEFDLISAQIEFLKDAKNSDNIVESNNLKFANSGDANAYKACEAELNDLYKKPEEKDFTNNDKAIEEIEKQIEEINPNNCSEEELQRLDLLAKLIEILEKAKKSPNPIEIGNLMFASGEDADKYNKYIASIANLDDASKNINNDTIEKPKGIRKKIARIRDIAFLKAKNFIEENKEALIATGAAVTTLVVAFRNSIAPESAIQTFMQTLTKYGTMCLGGGVTFVAAKAYKNKDRLISDKEIAMVDNNTTNDTEIIDNDAEFVIDTKKINPNIDQTNKVIARIEHDAHQENLTDEGKTEEEILDDLRIGEAQTEFIRKDEPTKDEELVSTSKVSAPETATSKKELTPEEKAKLGQEIIERQEKARAEAKARIVELEAKRLEEERIEKEALAKAKPIETPTVEPQKEPAEVIETNSEQEVKPISANEKISPEEIKQIFGYEPKIEDYISSSKSETPVIVVPSAEEVINALNSEPIEAAPAPTPLVVPKMSQEEIERMLGGDGYDTIPEVPVDKDSVKTPRMQNVVSSDAKAKTGAVLEKIVSGPETPIDSEQEGKHKKELLSLNAEATYYQKLLDEMPNSVNSEFAKKRLEEINQRIEEINKEGRSL